MPDYLTPWNAKAAKAAKNTDLAMAIR